MLRSQQLGAVCAQRSRRVRAPGLVGAHSWETFASHPTHGAPPHSRFTLASPLPTSQDPGSQHRRAVGCFLIPRLQNVTTTLAVPLPTTNPPCRFPRAAARKCRRRSGLKTIEISSLAVLGATSPKSKHWQGHAPSEGCRGESASLFPGVGELLATLDFPELHRGVVPTSANCSQGASPVCAFVSLGPNFSLLTKIRVIGSGPTVTL